MRRWLTHAGLDPALIDAPEPAGHIPPPDSYTHAHHWLRAVQRYLALSPTQMERLIDADTGTWARLQSGEQPANTTQIRTLLRRVPEARAIYHELGQPSPTTSYSPTAAKPAGPKATTAYSTTSKRCAARRACRGLPSLLQLTARFNSTASRRAATPRAGAESMNTCVTRAR